MTQLIRVAALAAALLLAGGAGTDTPGQTAPAPLLIPPGATSLEGTPSVRVDANAEATTRRVLTASERAGNRLSIRVRDGRLFWASRNDRPLEVHAAGEFTYLSADPGHYIKLRKLDDRISYVEHIEQGAAIVTYWGELRIQLGKR